ncbi:putative AAA-ATPase [Bifidobacterium lemurum]|uniref:Putative AAA-ATPase n=1 Tax=Bifidobacterium lemurum TaxID=1603886 RepID=A0A261FT87_9BIFI|nr:AAA family ATPase [Bifidobacterium lemurum]OZG62367.1 putative AAA-ATPase [Bifidobacterium lemurum]QOL33727.1 AAA family ATPase [Bifidobacterium lemurum]
METTALESCGNGVWRGSGACIVDRTGRKRLPIGQGDFAVVASQSVFVDKTRLIADVLDSGYSVTLFCRPRRFGKTLNMTMMRTFFELSPDGRDNAPLFDGTDIWESDDGHYRRHQGAYPVISMSMLTAKGLTWPQTFGSLRNMIADEYGRHRYLLNDGTLPDDDRAYITRILSRQAGEDDCRTSLTRLVAFLNRYHQRPVVVLLDEYDAPIMAAYSAPNGGYYDEAVAFVKAWLTGTLKDSGEMLAFACLTGVQRISKDSIFSDLNNLIVNTALSTDFDERYGFSEDEVAALSDYLGCGTDGMDTARQWYDGYRFGKQDVYNPWSVLNFLDNDCAADVYWGNTSGNGVVGDLLRSADVDTLRQVYDLMEPGGTVAAPLDLGVVFPDLGVKNVAIWSMLYLAGYLTTEDTALPGRSDLLRRLRIPNLEIAQLYKSEIINRFADMAGGNDRLDRFHRALYSGDEETVLRELTTILRDSVSSFDMTSENSLHMLVTGLCFGMPGYVDPKSNKESGYGRYDLRLEPSGGDPANFSFVAPTVRPLITIELKYVRDDGPSGGSDSERRLEDKAQEALTQISERGYDEGEPPQQAQGRLRWGIAVSGRRCAVACERLD